MRGLTILLSVAACSGAFPAAAQYRPGLTVRVTTAADLQPIVGLLRSADSTSLIVDSLAIPFSRITRVDVYQGPASHAGSGALIGTFTGFLVGGIIGSARGESSGYGLIGGIVGAPLLGLVGLWVGSSIPAERWTPLPLDRLRPGRSPAPEHRLMIGAGIEY